MGAVAGGGGFPAPGLLPQWQCCCVAAGGGSSGVRGGRLLLVVLSATALAASSPRAEATVWGSMMQ